MLLRMARVNVYLPDALHERAKRARLNVSDLCQQAIESELGRRRRLRVLERLADETTESFGEASTDEVAAVEAWVDQVMSAARTAAAHRPRSPRSRGRPGREREPVLARL